MAKQPDELTEQEEGATVPAVPELRARHRTKIQDMNTRRLEAHKAELEQIVQLFGLDRDDAQPRLKYPELADPYLTVFLMVEEDLRRDVSQCVQPPSRDTIAAAMRAPPIGLARCRRPPVRPRIGGSACNPHAHCPSDPHASPTPGADGTPTPVCAVPAAHSVIIAADRACTNPPCAPRAPHPAHRPAGLQVYGRQLPRYGRPPRAAPGQCGEKHDPPNDAAIRPHISPPVGVPLQGPAGRRLEGVRCAFPLVCAVLPAEPAETLLPSIIPIFDDTRSNEKYKFLVGDGLYLREVEGLSACHAWDLLTPVCAPCRRKRLAQYAVCRVETGDGITRTAVFIGPLRQVAWDWKEKSGRRNFPPLDTTLLFAEAFVSGSKDRGILTAVVLQIGTNERPVLLKEPLSSLKEVFACILQSPEPWGAGVGPLGARARPHVGADVTCCVFFVGGNQVDLC